MVKILGGLVAAIVIAVGGFFGFEFYVQHRVVNEIDGAFEQIRASGGKASHGKVSFDLLNRTVTVADIASQSAAQPPVSLRIASVTAYGVSQPDITRFSADSIDVADIEINAGLAQQPGLSITYKAPRIIVKDYSGPAGPQQPPASSSAIDLYRFAIGQFIGVTATSIIAPSLAGTMNLGGATQGGSDFAYSSLAIEGVKDGKIAAMKIDRVAFTANTQPAGKPEKLTGNLENIAGYDIDLNAMAAIFDPQKVNDDQYYRAYRQITVGSYVVTSAPATNARGQGLNMRIDGMTIDNVALRPSRMQLPDLLAMVPPAGAAPPTPAQARAMLEKVARLYEGMRIGNAEMRGFSVETPQGPLKLSAMRFNLEGGKVSEFAIEGLDSRIPKGPFKVARFALKSLDISNLMRTSALFANPAQQPPPDQALGMLALIEGIEVKGLAAPFKDTGKPVNIDAFSLDWGQFVGPIPSKLRLALKMSAPLDTSDPGQKMLVAAGLDKVAIDLDLGAAWTEATRAFALEPVTLDLGGLLKASARVSLANVPRGVFSPNAVQAAAMAGQIEAGALELTLRDMGAVDLAVVQHARAQNVSREAARRAIIDNIKASGEQTGAANPDTMAVVEALTRFVETPRQTLVIRLTPLGKVPALQLMQLLKTDPLVALAQFRIEASTGL